MDNRRSQGYDGGTTMSNHTTYQLWDMGFVVAETTRAKQAETWSKNGGKVTAITQ